MNLKRGIIVVTIGDKLDAITPPKTSSTVTNLDCTISGLHCNKAQTKCS